TRRPAHQRRRCAGPSGLDRLPPGGATLKGGGQFPRFGRSGAEPGRQGLPRRGLSRAPAARPGPSRPAAMRRPASTKPKLTPRPEHVFPGLTRVQMDRVVPYGRVRRVGNGEVLLEMGESGRIFVVTAGSIETVRMSGDVEEVIVTHGVGSFTGEIAVL